MSAPVCRLAGLCTWWLLLAACSNGTGSVSERAQEPQSPPPPPTLPAQESFTVGGVVSGLTGSGLVLQINGGNNLPIPADGPFTFSTPLSSAAAYTVTVLSQPASPAQTCSVSSGGGVIATANVTNVTVTCSSGAFAVRGTVAGLLGTGLVLRNNGGDDLAIAADGPFAFPTLIAVGGAYNVTVATPPANPPQTCSIANPAGTMGAADVSSVAVTCSTAQITIGGTVTGLAGSGLVLANNGGDDLVIAADGPFVFKAPLASGATYSVSVKAQPSSPAQTCTISNPTGIAANTPVTNVAVTCSSTPTFVVGGSVSGLVGTGLSLLLNDSNEYKVTANGPFTFDRALPSGAAYRVTIKSQPKTPTQRCTLQNAQGTIANSNVANVLVTCVTRSFAVGGSVSGLRGTGLVLQNLGGQTLTIASDGNFRFPVQASGSPYQVSVLTQPAKPAQSCTVANGSGTVGGADVTNIRVTCATTTFTVRAAVTGLLGSGLVLDNNGGDPIEIGSDGVYPFPRRVASGGAYDIRVRTAPSNPVQSCVVASPSGIIENADVTVAVSCSTSQFTVGGTVTSLAGTGLELRNNLTDQLFINENRAFTFAIPLQSGATYSVTIGAQPTNPSQSCSVINGAGTVGSANVTNVVVECVSSGYSIGGQVLNLIGSGLVLQNNGADNLPIASSGPFAFSQRLTFASVYNVTVLQQPANPAQTCTVADGVGLVIASDITNVTVSCVLDAPGPPLPSP